LNKYRWTIVIITTIDSFIISLLLWCFLGGRNVIFASGMMFGGVSGTFIAGVLAGTYLDKKEKRRQKNQALVNKAK